MGAITFEDEPPPSHRLPPVVVTKGGDDPDAKKADAASVGKDDGAPAGGAVTFDADPPALTPDQEIRRDKLKQLIDAEGQPGYGARFKDALTLGLSRPIGGALSVAGGEIGEYFGGKPATIGERWKGGVQAEDDYYAQAAKNTDPRLGMATDIAGGLLSGGPVRAVGGAAARGAANAAIETAPRIARTIGGALRNIGRKAVETGVTSAGQGAIEGAARNSESWDKAGAGAVSGGVIGGGTGLVTGGALGALTERQAAKAAVGEASRMGGSEAVQDTAGQIYTRLDNAGITYNPQQTTQLLGNTMQRLGNVGFNPNMQREMLPVLGEILDAAGQPVTWTQLKNMRTQLGKLKARNDDNLRRVAGDLTDELDEFVRTQRPRMPLASAQAGVNPAREVEVARDLWHRGSQAENIEYKAAKDQLTTNNPSNTLRTNFGKEHNKIIDPERFSKHQNSPEQVEQIAAIASGDPRSAQAAKTINRWSDNFLRYGSLGSAAGLATMASGIGDPYGIGSKASTFGPTVVAAALLGKAGSGGLRQMVAQRGADRVNTLIRNIVTGSPERAAVEQVPRDALARVLAGDQLKRGLSRYTSSLFDNKEEDEK